ncbi:MAG: UDP-N-acetylmuramoyl-L-alanyl-D-glutamate--2,6-diaminopimelate ligase, partial [Gammaproteobacteria bacterium]|nr:UDP-N-acetylmuramoyl-L-alanyl-D-glutamate--2,6-diaminopimelate ligase [Gammaproteobacteria bacterium]
LGAALGAARRHLAGALTCVLGCGGDRDRGKRPLMAAAAEAGADAVVLTSDNPRGEDPNAIVADTLAGFDRPANVTVEVDRARAVRRAIEDSGTGDVVLIAGKGHEDYQEVAGRRVPYSDVEAARKALADRPGAPGGTA